MKKCKIDKDLSKAIGSSDFKKIKKCIEQGADIDLIHEGVSALHLAAMLNNEDIAQFLLKRGAAVMRVNNQGDTPMHCAARAKSIGVIKLLLEYGSYINVTNDNGDLPLACINKNNQDQEIITLLSPKSKINESYLGYLLDGVSCEIL